MTNQFLALVLIVSLPWSDSSALPEPKESVPANSIIEIVGATAITNVNVIPMNRNVVLENQTVVVNDTMILAMGKARNFFFSPETKVIDGEGKYLIPGLADMHVHLRNVEDLPVYFTGGVTTILDMGAAEVLLQWREQLEEGTLVGPRLLVSRFIDGAGGRGGVVTSVEAARVAVREAAEKGYDFIKVYNSLTTEQFDAILAEASSQGISVIGHVVRAPGLKYSLEAGQRLIAHAEEYIYTIFGNRDARNLIPAAVELTRRTNTYVIPNLSAFETMARQWGRPEVVEEFFEAQEARYLHPSYQASWRNGNYTSRSGSLNARVQFLKELTKALQDGGVVLLAGTDSPFIPGAFAGASIHHDMQLMVDAGLTPYEALRTATANVKDFLQETRPDFPRIGVVQKGASPDLVLLAENPLEDISAARHPLGVMKAGIWWTEAALLDYLDSLN